MNPNPQIRVKFVIRSVLIAVVLIFLLLPTGAGVIFMAGLTVPICGGAGDPSAYGLAFEDIRIPAPSIGGVLRAYFIPASAPARGTIIGVPTGAAGRGDRLHELRLFQAAGYNILAYESRTCAARQINSLGYLEVDQVGDALAYLQTRADVDLTRVGIHGFSAGGSTAIMAAARYRQISAVIAQGGYHDFWGEVAANTAVFDERIPFMGALFRFGAQVGYQMTTGVDVSVLVPHVAITQIAPRPVLLIYGTDEPGLSGAEIMAASGDHVELWRISGAGHGNYVTVVGEADYARITAAFWDRTIGGETPTAES